ncbi:MAG: alpha/beta fold hydrolase [Alphaproteobacteria bacterium]|nr:alpha/beta fold hydrolase [Alphaproteobacteria bacterium]
MKTTAAKNRAIRLWVIAALLVLLPVGLWQIFADQFPSEEKALRSQVRQAVIDAFPDHAREAAAEFGLFPFPQTDPTEKTGEATCGTVVLVHGLDDPGLVWRSLAPALVDGGHEVWYLNYPNDQPIADSAIFFAERLHDLRSRGSTGIAIVAHSMGGLVARETLTSPQIDYPRRVAEGKAPTVHQLIMVGTPNHGSELARFRIFAEIRDQSVALAQGKAHWLRGIVDGAGEAKIDLLPESEFLTRLNARDHPADLDMLVIAGLASPWNSSEIEDLRQTSERTSDPRRADQPNHWNRALSSVTDGLGDGLVAVDSARLDGVPHLTVSGNHLSMIRNSLADSPRVPPSVPVVLENLPPCAEGQSGG